MSTEARNFMAYEKALKWQFLNGSLARRLIIRGFMFSVAISVLPLMQIFCGFDALKLYPASVDKCSSDLGLLDPNSYMGRVLRPVTPNAFPHISYARCQENVNVTVNVVKELMDKQLLNSRSRALCLGGEPGSAVSALRKLGFARVDGVGIERNSFFARKQKEIVYELHYKDGSFEFLIARDLEKVSVPALFVNEMERVLKPGGIAAVVLRVDGSAPGGGLIRSAMAVSHFLRGSSVVHVASLNEKNTLVAFRKKLDHVKLLAEYQLPADCASLTRSRPYIDRIEPLVDAKPTNHNDRKVAYLAAFLGITSSMRLVYVDMGKREVANFSLSNSFLASYPIDPRAFNVYIVDHNALVLASHVQEPGINFIYHPGLSETNSAHAIDEDTEDIPMDDVEFDFLTWFKQAVMHSDFMVLKMSAGRADLKFLAQLFESGAICSVDELFLECSDSDLVGGDREVKLGETCMDLFRSLRRAGVFVHQWW